MRREDVWGNGCKTPRILNLDPRCRWVVRFTSGQRQAGTVDEPKDRLDGLAERKILGPAGTRTQNLFNKTFYRKWIILFILWSSPESEKRIVSKTVYTSLMVAINAKSVLAGWQILPLEGRQPWPSPYFTYNVHSESTCYVKYRCP
jgi:hypothetical protein